jgi:hypothetical protein
MRIAFCGASGTGKTTLAKALGEFFELERNPVGARSVAREMGFDNPYDVDRAGFAMYKIALTEMGRDPKGAAEEAMSCWSVMEDRGLTADMETVRGLFQQTVRERKIRWELDHHEFVTDRTTIDDVIYTLLHAPMSLSHQAIQDARAHMARYTTVFFCGMDAFHDTAGDSNRINSVEYHQRFEAIARWLLAGTFTTVLPVPAGPVDYRAGRCCGVVRVSVA